CCRRDQTAERTRDDRESGNVGQSRLKPAKADHESELLGSISSVSVWVSRSFLSPGPSRPGSSRPMRLIRFEYSDGAVGTDFAMANVADFWGCTDRGKYHSAPSKEEGRDAASSDCRVGRQHRLV